MWKFKIIYLKKNLLKKRKRIISFIALKIKKNILLIFYVWLLINQSIKNVHAG